VEVIAPGNAVFLPLLTGIPDVEPFYLYFNRSKPWLDVPALYLEWRYAARIQEGDVFRAFYASGQLKEVLPNGKPALVSCYGTSV
jgi:hypothetical protein